MNDKLLSTGMVQTAFYYIFVHTIYVNAFVFIDTALYTFLC